MSDDSRAGRAYFELAGRPGSVLTFARPDGAAMQALREAAQHLPVRSYKADDSGVDLWEEVALVGTLDAVLARLSSDIQRDYADTVEHMSHTVTSDLLITEGNVHRDALHVITRLRPKSGEDESISYGARIQRLDSSRYALWSDY